MVITSGFRCARYNVEVSSSGEGGPHTTGRAVDVQVSGPRAYRLLHLALAHGFSGVGVKQHGPHDHRFLHFDSVPRPYPVIWSYA